MYDLGSDFGGETVEPGTNVLVSGPPLTGKRHLVLRVLKHGSERGEGSIVVTTRDSSERVLEDFRSILDDPEIDIGVVDCVTKHQGQSVRDSETVKYASSPVDMTGVGIRFSEFLEEFHQERGIERNRVMFDSLSTVLLYSDLQTVFRFMHVFTSRIESSDALGLHVIDSTAHDDETMNTLKQLFDGIVHTDEDGNVDVQIPGIDAGAVGT